MTQTSEVAAPTPKIDKPARVRSTLAQREAALADFDRSGLTAAKFAALAGIKYQTMAAWLWKRRKARKSLRASTHRKSDAANSQAARSMQWVEAVPDGGQSSLRLELRGGMRLEINSTAQVPLAVQLLNALESRGEGRSC